ncbi:MAG: peptidoglycan DD-metalloendopeptidase family protein [Thermodesulfobacteriota bacterium]
MPPLTAVTQICKKLNLWAGTLLSCFLLLLISSNWCLGADRKVEKQRLEQKIQSARINIGKLQEGIEGQRDLIQSSKEQERNLLSELREINTGILVQLDKLAELEDKVTGQQEMITIEEDKLKVLGQARQGVQDHLQKRIKAYYKMGKIGFANVAFSTENMPRMLIFRDSFGTLIEYDKGVINNYRHTIDEIQRSKVALQREKGVLENFLLTAKEEQATTEEIKKEKEILLDQIKNQKDLHAMAVREMKKAADGLSTSLSKMKKKSDLYDQAFLMDKGKHPAPVQGKVVALFDQKRKNKLGVSGQSMGITISAPGSNEVQAIFEGEILHASYLQGYGNTIIINHGHQYFSILSRLEKLLKQKGDKVEQGDIIGLTGDTATIMDDGIYFEIRHGSTPVDPLPWLDKKGLVLP